jgi:hypothetical protein
VDGSILWLIKSSHLVALVLDSDRENPLFQSPVGPKAEHILDIGTGKGNWAMYVEEDGRPELC